jgi:hypothetical protein
MGLRHLFSPDVAEQLKLKTLVVARQQYGAFSRAIAERLGYVPPQRGQDRSQLVVHALDHSTRA